MKRNAIENLIRWKSSEDRKPLILKGARQVGKTWLMKHFGKTEYENYYYFNFDENPGLSSIFEQNKDSKRIIELLGVLVNTVIRPKVDLIIFDEIQESSAALNSLKYFNEQSRGYHVICAGSLLGTLLAQPQSYPVGQVNILNIYPLTFDEFLENTNEGLYKYYLSINKGLMIETLFHEKLLEVYNYYLIIGGMPEGVFSWINYRDMSKVDRIQKEIIEIYKNDFAKHNGKVNSGRILLVFESLVSQLAKENKKFVYGLLRQGARAREYEDAIEWLVSSGLIHKVYMSNNPAYPLKAYDDPSSFKLYLFDTGLLKQIAGIDNETILLKTDFAFKGALAENFVLQQIIDKFLIEPRYYNETRVMETDFLIQEGGKIYPIEVKAESNIKSKSLVKYNEKFGPELYVRYSKLNFVKDGKVLNIPLYLAPKTKELL
jgi:uncharacterized protein